MNYDNLTSKDIAHYYPTLHPLILWLNQYDQLDDLAITVLGMLNPYFERAKLDNSKDIINTLNFISSDLIGFFNYPRLKDLRHFVLPHYDNLKKLQASELYPIDSDYTEEVEELFFNGYKTLLARFISFYESNNIK